MRVGVQFTGTLPASQTRRWFTYNWNPNWHVIWTLMPITVAPGAAQIDWAVGVERAAAGITYWITIRNLTASPVTFEARYAIAN